MPSYRIEISPNNRAGCKDTVCKTEGVKILKGELRLGTWVEINEHGSWSWKHWGCVSGSQLLHLQEACDKGDGTHDFEAIDGFDELEGHAEVQEKVRRCVRQGHIDPEDFKGDPEKNVPGEKGIRLTAKQKAAKDKAATDAAKDVSDEEAPKKKASKRGRNKVDAGDDEDEKPTVKKAKSSEAAKPSKATKPSKAPKAVKAAKADQPGAPRGKSTAKSTAKKAAKDESDAVTTDEEDLVEKADKPPVKASKAKTSAKARGKTDNASENAPQKNRRSSRVIAKSSTDEDGSAESEEPAPVAKSKRGAKLKKPAAEQVAVQAKPRRASTRNA